MQGNRRRQGSTLITNTETMARYNIQVNPRTLGLYAFFKHKGSEYYADLCDVPWSIDYVNECMIFHAKDGQVTDWSELYCKRNIPITEEALAACIDEFKNSLKDNRRKDNGKN